MATTDSGNLKKYWIETVQEDENGELILPFPQEMLDEVGWKPGDNLEWIDRGDGTWEIRRKNELLANGDS
jgi:bifunctional DNA-binding transcriptional regulator/antitoxin component of YhaV-PrlF toxin-antitoxin module